MILHPTWPVLVHPLYHIETFTLNTTSLVTATSQMPSGGKRDPRISWWSPWIWGGFMIIKPNQQCHNEANSFAENHLSSSFSENPFAAADTACNSCVKTYFNPTFGDIPLIGKRKLHRRPSFLKATWGPDRVRFTGDRTTATASSQVTIPDLFPCVDVHGRVRNTLCYAQPMDHNYLHAFRRNSRKSQKLRHSQSTRLPTYKEAVFHNVAAVRRASSLVHRPYSYPELPVYQSPLSYGPAELCNIFPCMGHPSDSVYGGYRAPTHLHNDHLVPIPGSRVVHSSPIVPMTWGRISSLESEVWPFPSMCQF